MIPKNASRTIKYHIEIAHPDFVFLGVIPIYRPLWRGYTKFAVLRNDQDRYDSAYRDKVVNRKVWTFSEYNKYLNDHSDPHVTPQALLFDYNFVDIVLDAEYLDELFSRLRINPGKIEHINKTQ